MIWEFHYNLSSAELDKHLGFLIFTAKGYYLFICHSDDNLPSKDVELSGYDGYTGFNICFIVTHCYWNSMIS